MIGFLLFYQDIEKVAQRLQVAIHFHPGHAIV